MRHLTPWHNVLNASNTQKMTKAEEDAYWEKVKQCKTDEELNALADWARATYPPDPEHPARAARARREMEVANRWRKAQTEQPSPATGSSLPSESSGSSMTESESN